jgi:hypothetical protein
METADAKHALADAVFQALMKCFEIKGFKEVVMRLTCLREIIC